MRRVLRGLLIATVPAFCVAVIIGSEPVLAAALVPGELLQLELTAPSQNTQPTHEVLVGTTPTQMLAFTSTVKACLQNSKRHSTSIFCARGSNVDGGSPMYPDAGLVDSLGRAHEIEPGASWSPPTPGGMRVWCLSSAAQDGGAGTIVDESAQ